MTNLNVKNNNEKSIITYERKIILICIRYNLIKNKISMYCSILFVNYKSKKYRRNYDNIFYKIYKYKYNKNYIMS